MRIVYLTLGFLVLFNIGVACRTPPAVAQGCDQVAGGLVHCPPEQDAGN